MNRLGRLGGGGLTPLLDTLFLLLFALLAISDVRREAREEEVVVELPGVSPEAAAAERELERLAVVVDARSVLRVGLAATAVETPRELDAALERELAGRAPQSVAVEIRADRDSRHGVSVELLEHLRRRGFRDVVLVAVGNADPERRFGVEEAGAQR